jgi:hypothetical protein
MTALERHAGARRAGIVVAIAFGRAAFQPARSQHPVMRVGPNVLVSATHRTDTHYEVVAAAHPRDPSQLVIGSIIYPEGAATYGTVAYRSSDGGASWTPTLGVTALNRTGDPAVAFGPDGTAFYVASSLPAAGERRLLLFRSPNGGATWDGPFPLTYMDREYVTVDAGTGASRGRVYVNGNNRVPRTISDFVLFSSSDSGRTFHGPATRSAFGSVQASVMGNAVVASDGTVIGVYVASQKSRAATIDAIRSVDGGMSLVPSATIDQYVAGGERKGVMLGNANAEPALAIDASKGSFNDRLYVVWPDRRSGHSQIRFSSSPDGGRTWSPSRVINDSAPSDTTDQFMPEVAVNRDGIVGVMWYDRRNHPDNLGWDVRFTVSADGGASFLPSVNVSERGTSFAPGTSRNRSSPRGGQSAERAQIDAGRDSFKFMGGDTAGLAADAAGVFHLVWIDNRTGTPQVWTAPVVVR